MFIFFGSGSRKIGEDTKRILDGTTARTAIIAVYQRYAHVFWIPLFPITRNYVIHFPDTGETYSSSLFNKIPNNYQDACKEVGAQFRTPIWMFAGLLIIAAIIIFAKLSAKG